MPHAIVFHCFTKTPVDAAFLRGERFQAAFLNLVNQIHPELATDLHGGDSLRGYSVGVVWPRLHEDHGLGVRELKLRVACLDDRIYPAIAQWTMAINNAPRLRLGRAEFEVARVLVTPESGEPWAGYVSVEGLIAGASDRETTVRLEFASPTSFRQGGRDEPLPLPRHVFGGLARRWNQAFGDRLKLPIEGDARSSEDFLKYVEDHIILEHPFEFRSTVVRREGDFYLTGFVGRANYRIISRPGAAFVHYINLLADLSFFSGLGAKTSRGCGMVRRLNRNGESPRQA
jgi:CRISPR-associated endoribonuclease Cas6